MLEILKGRGMSRTANHDFYRDHHDDICVQVY